MWFSEEMSECVDDIGRAFCGFFEAKKIPVLQVTKFDVIEETPDIYQVMQALGFHSNDRDW